MSETQTCRSGSQAGSLLLQTGLLSWGCYPMALAGRQLHVFTRCKFSCRWPSLHFSLHPLVSCEMPAVL